MLIWKKFGRLINGEIAVGFALSTLFWIAVLGWAASYFPDPEKEKACYQAAAKTGHDTEQRKTLWERTTTEPIALFTFVLSAATIGLWLATIFGIWRQSDETKILQRAYIDAIPLGIRPMIGSNDLIAHVAFRNKGHLPARNIHAGVKIGWFADGNKEIFDGVVVGEGSMMLLPQTETEQGTSSLTAAEATNVRVPRGYVYVWGRIEYNDGFASRWRTFCHRYNCVSLDKPRLHHHHNDGD